MALAGWDCSELSGPGHAAVRADLGQHRRPGRGGRLRRHHHDRARPVGDLRGRARGDRAVRARTRDAACSATPRCCRRARPRRCRRSPGRRAAAARRPATISSASSPFLIASAARWCDRAANSSCSSRLMSSRALCRSVDSPIERWSNASVSPSCAIESTQLGRAEPEALARPGQQVRRLAHRLHAPGHHDVELAGPDQLGGQRDRVQAGQAHLVDRERGHRHRDARPRPPPAATGSGPRRPAAPGP